MKSFEQMVRIASNYVGVFPESQKAFLNEIESSNNTDYENKKKTEKQEITKTNLKFMNPDFLNSFEKSVNFN